SVCAGGGLFSGGLKKRFPPQTGGEKDGEGRPGSQGLRRALAGESRRGWQLPFHLGSAGERDQDTRKESGAAGGSRGHFRLFIGFFHLCTVEPIEIPPGEGV